MPARSARRVTVQPSTEVPGRTRCGPVQGARRVVWALFCKARSLALAAARLFPNPLLASGGSQGREVGGVTIQFAYYSCGALVPLGLVLLQGGSYHRCLQVMITPCQNKRRAFAVRHGCGSTSAKRCVRTGTARSRPGSWRGLRWKASLLVRRCRVTPSLRTGSFSRLVLALLHRFCGLLCAAHSRRRRMFLLTRRMFLPVTSAGTSVVEGPLCMVAMPPGFISSAFPSIRESII